MNFSTAAEAMDHGFAMITEERKANGLFLKGDLTFNTTIANLNQYKAGPILSDPKMTKATVNELKVMNTKAQGPSDLISSLSGGNQQKVVLAKWLATDPKILIVDEPTRGIDVGTKSEVHRLISTLATRGVAVIMISSELPEVLGMADRVLVMCEGRITGEFTREEATADAIMTAATDHEKAAS